MALCLFLNSQDDRLSIPCKDGHLLSRVKSLIWRDSHNSELHCHGWQQMIALSVFRIEADVVNCSDAAMESTTAQSVPSIISTLGSQSPSHFIFQSRFGITRSH